MKTLLFVLLLCAPASGQSPILMMTSGTSGGTVATPTDSPGAGTYFASPFVSFATTTPGATICYTSSSTPPTPTATVPGTCDAFPTQTLFGGFTLLTGTQTEKVIATKAGMTNSGVLTTTYVVNVAVAFDSPSTGNYSNTHAQLVTIFPSPSGAVACYRTDGTPPAATTPGTCDAGSITYSAPFSLTKNTTIKMLGTKVGFGNGSVFTSTYTFVAPIATPTASPTAGSYTGAQTVMLADSDTAATICFTTDGSDPAPVFVGFCGRPPYSGPLTVSANTTIKAVATKSGAATSDMLTAAYVIH
jgi:hypothetical protein